MTEPLTLAIYCDAASHPPHDVDVLVANEIRDDAGGLIRHVWIPQRSLQRNFDPSHEGFRPHRSNLRCDICGDSLTLGDLLGKGWSTAEAQTRVLEKGQNASEADARRVMAYAARNEKAHRNLSCLADALAAAGSVSELSLRGLRRTLQTP